MEKNSPPATAAEAPLVGGNTDLKNLLDDARVRAVHTPVVNANGSMTYFIGGEVRAHDVPALNPVLPDFVTAAEIVVEPASFIDYIIGFKSSKAICRASLSGNKITAVLDYHGRARENDHDAATPGRQAHSVTLNCPFDLDYAKWRKILGVELDQRNLAEFIEDMLHTIGSPAAADLLEAIADLKIDRAVKFKSARNERNGNVQFSYEEVDSDVKGAPGVGSISLPEKVEIVVPIFQGGPPVLLKAKLRYRMDKGALTFILAVPGLDLEERTAFRSIGERVRNETNTPVFYAA